MGLISPVHPTVGTYLAVALPALIAILSDQPLDAVWVIIFATVYQRVENYWFSPRISSKTMDIHPAVAFRSVIAGAALFGPIGALIGIPVARRSSRSPRPTPGATRSSRNCGADDSEPRACVTAWDLFCQSFATLTCRSRYARSPAPRSCRGTCRSA